VRIPVPHIVQQLVTGVYAVQPGPQAKEPSSDTLALAGEAGVGVAVQRVEGEDGAEELQVAPATEASN
jgi:hypothetical protein